MVGTEQARLAHAEHLPCIKSPASFVVFVVEVSEVRWTLAPSSLLISCCHEMTRLFSVHWQDLYLSCKSLPALRISSPGFLLMEVPKDSPKTKALFASPRITSVVRIKKRLSGDNGAGARSDNEGRISLSTLEAFDRLIKDLLSDRHKTFSFKQVETNYRRCPDKSARCDEPNVMFVTVRGKCSGNLDG